MSKVVTLSQAIALRARWRAREFPVVFTNGCFDLLHVGHVRYLQQARRLGRRLVIGVNSDDSVRRIKGPTRPIVPANERAEVLAALRSVDAVVIFDEDTAETLVERLTPDVYVKGADYGPGRKDVPEARVVERQGGHVVLIPFVEGRSTTALIDRIQRLQT